MTATEPKIATTEMERRIFEKIVIRCINERDIVVKDRQFAKRSSLLKQRFGVPIED